MAVAVIKLKTAKIVTRINNLMLSVFYNKVLITYSLFEQKEIEFMLDAELFMNFIVLLIGKT